MRMIARLFHIFWPSLMHLNDESYFLAPKCTKLFEVRPVKLIEATVAFKLINLSITLSPFTNCQMDSSIQFNIINLEWFMNHNTFIQLRGYKFKISKL